MERFLSVVSRSWVEFTKLAVALGVAYFLTARLSFFVFRAEPGVAVFWPASGIAVGVFDRLGFQGATAESLQRSLLQTIAHNRLAGTNPWLTVAFGPCQSLSDRQYHAETSELR